MLKIRNAPANRAIAAIRAVVAWKSAVDARSAAARSCGDERTYGSRGQARLERGRDGRPVGAGAEPDVDPRHAGLVEDGLGGLERDDDGPPERPGERPVAGHDPDDAIADRVAGGLHRERRSDGQAILRGEALGDQGAVLAGFAQRRAGDEDEVVESRVEDRVDAEDRDRRREGRVVEAPGAR